MCTAYGLVLRKLLRLPGCDLGFLWICDLLELGLGIVSQKVVRCSSILFDHCSNGLKHLKVFLMLDVSESLMWCSYRFSSLIRLMLRWHSGHRVYIVVALLRTHGLNICSWILTVEMYWLGAGAHLVFSITIRVQKMLNCLIDFLRSGFYQAYRIWICYRGLVAWAVLMEKLASWTVFSSAMRDTLSVRISKVATQVSR